MSLVITTFCLCSPGLLIAAAFQSSPDTATPSLTDATALLSEGHIEKAEQNTREFLRGHPASGEGHFLLGLILFRKIQAKAVEGESGPTPQDSSASAVPATLRAEYARASLAEYTEGAKYKRPGAPDLKIVALNYVLLGSYADASKWLARSLKENPNDAESWYYLGRSKYNENRFEEAIQAFERCLALEPQNVKAQSNLGLSYAGLNLIPEAQAAFLKAIEWQVGAPGNALEAYIGLGDVLIQQNRASEAIPYLLKAVEVAPKESRAREKLASAYLNLNQLTTAQEQLEAAISLDPQNPGLHYLLGTVYRKQGQPEKAKAEFERFQSLKEAAGTARP